MARVLVGVDGSSASASALRWASGFAKATGDELVAVHAYQRPYAEVSPTDIAALLERRATRMRDEWVLPAEESGMRPTVEVIEGDPRTVLPAAIDEHDPDLVVLGRTGAGGGPGFLHLGSVVEHAAHHLDRPHAVIPTDGGGPTKRIVIGVDGSKPATAAIEWTSGAASSLGGEAIAVAVGEPPIEWTPSRDDGNRRRDALRDLQTWTEPLAKAEVPTELVVVEHLHPADGLLGVASGRGADLLVLGTRGAGGFTGLRFGGVAMKVLHRCSLPLVLVPPSGER